MKMCKLCQTEKPFVEFYKQTKAKDGLQSRCKLCSLEQRKAYYQTPNGKNKNATASKAMYYKHRALLSEYLSDKQCIRCDESDSIVLQFDHRDPSVKTFNISNMMGRFAWAKILIEIKKCDILCANCHTRRTAEQFGWFKNKTI